MNVNELMKQAEEKEKAEAQQQVAAAEEPKPDPPEEPPAPWQMPKPALGQCIKFVHRSAVRGEASIAWVEKTGMRSIVVATRGGAYEDVLHVDDPRLKTNPDLRYEIDGTWDFTEDNKKVEERLRIIEEKLALRL